MRQLLLIPIGLYRLFISPVIANRCRFYPTCSTYAQAVIRQHGFLKGLYFTLRRLVRCHPFHSGGYDPVPEKKKG